MIISSLSLFDDFSTSHKFNVFAFFAYHLHHVINHFLSLQCIYNHYFYYYFYHCHYDSIVIHPFINLYRVVYVCIFYINIFARISNRTKIFIFRYLNGFNHIKNLCSHLKCSVTWCVSSRIIYYTTYTMNWMCMLSYFNFFSYFSHSLLQMTSKTWTIPI